MAGIARIVIVGAGLAGGNAAAALVDAGFKGRVMLVGDEPGIPFGRPPLSKTYLRGKKDLGGWYVRPPGWYEAHGVEVIKASVRRVDTRERQALLDSGALLAYDRLILCSGGHARRATVPGAHLHGIHYLRTIDDCEAIKRDAQPGSHAVVVGMGFIGSEVAASLRTLGVAVTALMVERAPLERVLGPETGAVMASIHEEHGVELVPGERLLSFEGSSRVEHVVTESNRRLPCDFVVAGLGIAPELSAVKDTEIVSDGSAILVDGRCRTSVPEVFAAGDVANHLHPLFGRVRVEHYNNAERMGAAAAHAALGDPAPYSYLHTFWSDQYEHKLEYAGHAMEWDDFVVRGDLDNRSFLGFYLKEGVIRAAIGFDRGGDPELDDGCEMQLAAELVARQVAARADVLEDETAPLDDL
ncbi:MAG: oxidoreductase [Candidatus Dormibacteraeota bacterium]|nr:oxidoreductase [Candidatus Dormibacteraeota bacterium]